MAILLYGQYKVARDTLERSERPYVLSESAFWRNGTSEAVVLIRNSGKSPAMKNETQIHFMATTDRSDSFRLDWGHMLPAFSSADLAPGASYTTPALTRLSPDQANDVLKGLGVAYVYGIIRYLDGFEKLGARSIAGLLMRPRVKIFSPVRVGRSRINVVLLRCSATADPDSRVTRRTTAANRGITACTEASVARRYFPQPEFRRATRHGKLARAFCDL
jgi:hypothetical protein